MSPVSLKDLAMFYFPLCSTSLLFYLIQTLLHGGLARTPDFPLSLSAFALARSLTLMICAYVFTIPQTITALAKDAVTFQRVCRHFQHLTLLTGGLLAFLGWTPLGPWVFTRLMGATGPLLIKSQQAIRLLVLLPLVMTLHQREVGLLIRAKKTHPILVGALIQLVTVGLLVFGLGATGLPGGVVGSLAYVGSFGANYLFLRQVPKAPWPKEDSAESLALTAIRNFSLPLILTAFVGMVFPPLVNAALTRSHNPNLFLPAFEIGFHYGMLLVGPLFQLHQCGLNFTAKANRRQVTRFTPLVSGGSVLGLLLAGFTPVGRWVFLRLLAVDLPVTQEAIRVVQVMAILPVLAGAREYRWGLFMGTGQAAYIGRGKALNLGITLAGVVIGIRWFPWPSAVSALWLLVLAEVVEYGYLRSRPVIQCVTQDHHCP
ncbi:MAG TPA: hypothetical protein GXX57_02575 [Firmicutes bacterium]|nr:hypothetical protein [Bacillota bacterium]